MKELRPSQLEIHTTEGDAVTLCGKIYRQEQKENGQMVYLKHNSIYSISNKSKFQESNIIIYTNSNEKLHIGNRIRVHGNVAFFEEARNPGNFDQKFYYQKQKIHGKIWADDIKIIDYRVDPLRDRLSQFRTGWKEMLIREMGEQDGKTLAAILLGEKSGMDQEMKELYRVSGIGHILAISGLHLSFAGLGIYRVFRRLTGSYKAGGLAGGVLLFLYVVMIGLTVSVIRAWVMFLFRIGADITGRHYDMPTALAAAAVTAIGLNPLYLYDGGFWLSFGAIFAVCVGTGINTILWPVILYNFFELPVYGMLLNLLVIPLMSVMLSCGMIGSLIEMTGIIYGKWMLWICSAILYLYDKCCSVAIKLPLARWVAGRPDKGRILLYYLLLFAAAALVKYCKKRRKYIISILLYISGLLILISGPLVRMGTEITMLDVGQGDCICVEGPEHKSYLIDGGSSDVKNVGRYRIEPFLKSRGIASLEFVFVSHGDLDHMSGIEEMLERQEMGVRIKNLVLPERMYWDDKLQNLADKAEKNNTDVWTIEAGKEIKEGRMKFTCLGPGKCKKDKTGRNLLVPGNAASMILHLEYDGFDMLFTGDVEKEGEEELIESLLKLQKEKKISWEILKTAHHGSKNSTTEEFLKCVMPRYAWISAGQKNRYGHPHQETLKRLGASGIKVYSTQQNGALEVTVKKKSMRIHGGNG